MTVVDVIVAIAMAAVVFAVWFAVTYGRLVRQRHRVDLCGTQIDQRRSREVEGALDLQRPDQPLVWSPPLDPRED